jgi:hypothetical protein
MRQLRECSVVKSLISQETIVECPPIALGLHVPALDLPLLHEIWHPLADVVVIEHVSEIIKS